MLRPQLLLVIFNLLFFLSLSAQTRPITGKVLSSDGGPLAGVSITVKGTKAGASTNQAGEFTISITPGSILVFSSTGYDSKEVPVGKGTSLTVQLVASDNKLGEVIVIGYGTQKKKEQTAAISTISGKDIIKSPVTDASNSLIGRVTGLFAQQKSGRPGISGAEISIRGRASTNSAALIIVDGVERQSFGDIDANEIESISVLKDASSTALFGIKGANGVIIVTTKTGKSGKSRVSYSGNVGIVSYTAVPEFLDAYSSAMLHNEGEENLIKYGLLPSNFQKLFTAQDLQTYKDGTGDPLLYPNVNWFTALTRPNWLRTQHNLNFSGGSRAVKYFVSIGYLYEDGGFKHFSTPSGYNTNPSYTRFNFRSNLDYSLTKSTTLSLRLGGRLENRYSFQANSGQGDFRQRYESGPEYLMSRLFSIPAWAIPFFPEYTNPATQELQKLDNTFNHIEDFGRLGVNTFNPYAVVKRNGYINYDNNAIESVFVLDQKLDAITKGLSLKVTFGYDAYVAAVRSQQGSYAAYNIDRSTKTLVLSRASFEDPLGATGSQNYGYIKTNVQAAINYARSFGQHNVSAVVVGQRELRGSEGAQAPFANEGVVLRTTYNYASRYFIELNGSYNGSENYPKNNRYGLFPAVSAGWTISEEKFMKNIKWVDHLKVRGSYGLIGYGNVGNTRFLYLDEYSNGGNTPGVGGANSVANQRVIFGGSSSNVSYPVAWHSRSGNPDVTWEKSIKRNLGIESSFFKNKFSVTADIFDEKRYDILLGRSNSTSVIFGETLPQSNYGENYNKGFEIELNYKKSTGQFKYGITAQLTHAVNKIVKTDEALNLPANQKTSGLSIGQFRGYKVIGFYKDLADIASSPVSKVGAAVIPGDFKFADISGGANGKPDGVIDDQDRVPIGYSDLPQNVFGIEPNISYKGFSISALVQGTTKVNSNIFFGGGNYYSPMLGRWTPDNPNPTWPVIKPRATSNPSYSTNNFLLQDASYVKLRNVEIGYSFPASVTKKLRLESLRVYVNGQNLKTWTKFVGLDPENNQNNSVATSFFSGAANSIPVTKIFNFGLNVQF